MKREHRAKRIAAILALAMALVFAMAVTAFGAETALTIESTTPKDGDTGMAIENMGVKVFFSEPVYDKDNAPGNIGKCSMKDENGKKVPTQVIFSEDDPNVMLVLADPNNANTNIQGKTEYTLTIEEGFTAASGNQLAKTTTISFTTLNPRNSMFVSMGMMVVMIGGMLFFGMRDTKKKQEEEKGKKKSGYEAVNPYKEAKRTGKSVDEIVAEEKKKKEKFEAKEAKEAAKKERHEKENKKEISDSNLRVSRPRPISEAGSTYKAPKK
jgi:hypothetical protein